MAPWMQQDVLQDKLNWIFSFEALTFSQWAQHVAWLELQFSLSFWYRLSWICVPKGQGLLAGLLGCGSLAGAENKGQGLGRTLLALVSENQGLGAFLLEIKNTLQSPPSSWHPLRAPPDLCDSSTKGLRCDPCPSASPQSWDLCLGLGNGFLHSRLGGFEAQSL